MPVTAPLHPSLTELEIAAYVDAAAAALGLAIAPAHRPGVLHYFDLAARMAAVIEAEPLSPHDDPALVFSPLSPADAIESSIP